jgi:hypothetical protein
LFFLYISAVDILNAAASRGDYYLRAAADIAAADIAAAGRHSWIAKASPPTAKWRKLGGPPNF